MKRLGVNIDHVATLRQVRGTVYPDPVAAAAYVEQAGADQVTLHLREDRRHIQDQDLRTLRRIVSTRLNLEMAATETMATIATEVRPDVVTLVPERRQELTTEGGLNMVAGGKRLRTVIESLRAASIPVSAFVEPDPRQIESARELGVDAVELHTGPYALAITAEAVATALRQLQAAARLAASMDLTVCAGHGLHYENTARLVVVLPEVEEYNIGHSIIARAIFVGLEQAVREMRTLLDHPETATPARRT
ncbi:MAG: pyridoxine 5'-phosphate synthase [Deltaproteobacteria bacterium]|nr:pyridoxine 5'-phosphate synthase [Deltaproteobacteria bacterium]